MYVQDWYVWLQPILHHNGQELGPCQCLPVHSIFATFASKNNSNLSILENTPFHLHFPHTQNQLLLHCRRKDRTIEQLDTKVLWQGKQLWFSKKFQRQISGCDTLSVMSRWKIKFVIINSTRKGKYPNWRKGPETLLKWQQTKYQLGWNTLTLLIDFLCWCLAISVETRI